VTEFHVALFFHLLGAFALISGLVVAAVAFESARRRSTPSEIALLLGLSRIGVLLVGIGVVVAVGCGFWLVDLGSFGGAGWVNAAIVLVVVLLGIGAGAGQRPKRARLLARELAGSGAGVSPELRVLLSDRMTLWANYVSALLLVAIVVLMVFKPGSTHH
jgi:uncharacterized membrane protein